MALVSITRLRLRRFIYEVPFVWHAVRSQLQARRADGNIALATRRTGNGTYWTLTVWRDLAAMRAYMGAGAHRAAMPKLMDWCDEAAVAHWESHAVALPSWSEAEERLARDGRLSKIKHPSPAHAAGWTLGTSRQ